MWMSVQDCLYKVFVPVILVVFLFYNFVLVQIKYYNGQWHGQEKEEISEMSNIKSSKDWDVF